MATNVSASCGARTCRCPSEPGVLFTLGIGVPEDHVWAYAWLNIAASSGVERAAKLKETLVDRMTREQIAQAQLLSRSLFQASELNNSNWSGPVTSRI